MSINKASSLLNSARRGKFALAAFNAVNMETAQAVVTAAEDEGAPVILQISENAARYAGLETLAAIGRELRRATGVDILLHFDHGESLESTKRAVELGFDSVMIEGADMPAEENISRVRELVAFAHSRGVAVEAEFEVVQKGTRRATSGGRPESVAELVERSGCDFAALDLGSEHKRQRGEASLNLERLKALAHSMPQPLVLHGGSSLPLDQLALATHCGVAKVNVATDLMRTFTEAVRRDLLDPGLYDPRAYLGSARSAMAESARRTIRALSYTGPE